jgi:predicted nucleic acid-binding protein
LAVILDTNSLSVMEDGGAELQPFLQEAAEVALPVIVLGEW